MARLVFLSHSGIDTDAARALKARMLAAPAAREQDLRVWFDKDDLEPGRPWQPQLEDAIAKSHAFAVYVGSKGVVNWVEAEVRLALSRAFTEPDYCFIPVLARDAPGPEALPGFAQQFQGVSDVENAPEQFEALVATALGQAEAGQLQLEINPFFGLRAIDESRNHLFFGREMETDKLVALLGRTPLVLITGDSGSGKSSLVRAGLAPRFHGGALAGAEGGATDDAIWHVVTTRPRNQPFRQLGEAVDEAAKELGMPLADRHALADGAASGDGHKVRRALRCDLPPDRVRVLLVVDQFEELLTITPQELREPFIDLLLDLANPADGRHRVVLTMRHDYVNLCNGFERLKQRLESDNRRARFRLGRMSDEGLGRVVTEPLRLAGIDPPDREALAREVLRDVGDRPGDLALVQMALTETWHARRRHDGNLLRAYADIGRVEGALAQAAERVRTRELDESARAMLDCILIRMVRLGDTGGATRRVAVRSEFDEDRWRLIQMLASDTGKRLVLIGGSPEQPTAEIAHEALVTAWPHYQTLLQGNVDAKRVLDALIPRAESWRAADEPDRKKRLATGADLEVFAALRDEHASWLSDDEQQFVDASAEAEAKRQRQQRRLLSSLGATAAILFVAVVVAIVFFLQAKEAEETAVAERDRASEFAKSAAESAQEAMESTLLAREAAMTARYNESRALAALSKNAANEHRYLDAVKLAIASWPRSANGDRPKLQTTTEALAEAQRRQRLVIPPLQHGAMIRGAIFNSDETRILTWSDDGTARLWDVATGKKVLPALQHGTSVSGAAFNDQETRILTWSGDGTARLWDGATGREVLPSLQHRHIVLGADFNKGGTRILTWSRDQTARVWDAVTGREVLPPLQHNGFVLGAVFNGDETRILTWSGDKTARVWDAATGREVLSPLEHGETVMGAVFNGDETRILTWSRDGTARVWDAATGRGVLTPLQHKYEVLGAVFNGDETRILTWSRDGTARVWDAATGRGVLTPLQHKYEVLGAVFNGDETRILTWSGDNTARLWDVATGEGVLPPLQHGGGVLGAAFNGDETRILTWSRDRTARLWDAATGQEVLLPLQHRSHVLGAAFNGDETRILTWSRDRTARLWDVATGQEVLPLLVNGHEVRGAVFNSDETHILTWSRDDTARLWDAETGRKVVPPLRHQGWVEGAIFSRDESRILSWSNDKTARVWDASTGKEVLPALQHGSSVNGATFNDDETRILTWSGDILTGSGDNAARLWDAATGREVVPPFQHGSSVNGAAFNGDETRILTWSSDGTARLWDAASGGKVLPPLRHGGAVGGAVFNGDETRILTWSKDNTARLWDVATGEEVLPPLQHGGDVWGAVFNGDETRILTWSLDNTARLWDMATGEEVLPPLQHGGYVLGAAFNGEETRIMTWSSDNTVRLWDVATGREVVTPLQHWTPVSGAVFNGNETRILTWSGNTGHLWDAATGREVLMPLYHEASINGAVFNGDETRILTWSFDSTARLWDISRLPRGHLIDVACGMLPDHDVTGLKDRYGVAITEPICGPDTPAPVWSELEE